MHHTIMFKNSCNYYNILKFGIQNHKIIDKMRYFKVGNILNFGFKYLFIYISSYYS